MELSIYRESDEPITRQDLEEIWNNEAMPLISIKGWLSAPEDGIPAKAALNLFGAMAVLWACDLDREAFKICEGVFFLTKRGAELAAAYCNSNACMYDYGADNMQSDLKALGFPMPER